MKIINIANIANQKCKLCGTEVEITHREVKRKSWKCPFCGTKNDVVFNNIIHKKEKYLPKPSKYKPSIKIVNYNKYGIDMVPEATMTMVFELILKGFNTPARLSTQMGLKATSCARYANELKSKHLVSGTASTGWWVLSNIEYRKV